MATPAAQSRRTYLLDKTADLPTSPLTDINFPSTLVRNQEPWPIYRPHIALAEICRRRPIFRNNAVEIEENDLAESDFGKFWQYMMT